MPSCLALGCTNTTGKPKEKEEPKSFHRIPDPQKYRLLSARWLNNMANAKWNLYNFEANRNRVLCSDHFHLNCYARDLMAELLGTDKFHQRKRRDRKLVEGAIPTIFKHKIFDEINIDGTKVLLTESASRKRSLNLERKDAEEASLAPLQQTEDLLCDYCQQNSKKNQFGQPEDLLICKDCSNKAHPSCLSYSQELVEQIRSDSSWQCIDCKACSICDGTGDPDTLLFCDACDKGYHMQCHTPKLEQTPSGKWACATCISKGKSVTSTSSTKQVLVIDDNDGSVGSSNDTKDELPTPQSSDDTMIAVNSITTVSSMEVMPIVSAPRRAVDPTPSASLQSSKVATPPIISVKPSNFVYHPSGLTYAPLPPGSSAVTLPPGHHPVSMPQPQFIPVNYMLPNGVPAAHQPPHGVPVQASRGVTPMIQPPPAHVVGTAPIPNQPTAAVAPQTQSVMGKGVRNDLSHILNPKVPLPDVRSSIRDDVLRALPTDVADWTVQNVAYYFKAHGYIHESKLLEEQEIDGRAMLLMSRNDCLTGLRIKLGPALKIYHMHIHKLQKKTDFLG
ncbi:uncharacterized protein [Clytia hemisphaerica]|uniref:uncharacterized protein isoform X3 n=1 Tax=Clytia hemisphaerica TaxID=252671 RepID=UPI0034D3B6EB